MTACTLHRLRHVRNVGGHETAARTHIIRVSLVIVIILLLLGHVFIDILTIIAGGDRR